MDPFHPSGFTMATAIMIVATTVVTTLTALVLVWRFLYPRRPLVIQSPLAEVISGRKPSAVEELEYYPDEFPGARDVDTPYGPIRIYEFGPASPKRKVLFIHGISTSCMILTRLAHALSEPPYDCRVMLFDLFGRGFSSAPSDLPHDSRLYLTQILLALASSPQSWTGNSALSVVGYSMGGALAMTLATTFPHMVESLVLLAPAGLIRPHNFGTASRLIFRSGWVPQRVLEGLAKIRLRTPIAGSVSKDKKEKKGSNTGSSSSSSSRPSSTNTLEQAVTKYVHWMLDHHEGFVPSFVGCVAAAPLTDQHHLWANLGDLLHHERFHSNSDSSDHHDDGEYEPRRYFPGGVAVILAREDEIVDAEDYERDGMPLIFRGANSAGEDGEVTNKEEARRSDVLWQVVGGGHNFPMTNSDEALAVIYRLWEMEKS